jgi:hypothetical protein
MSVGNIKTIQVGQYAAHATASGAVPPAISADDWNQARKKYVVCYCAVDAAASTDIERALFTVTPNHTGGIVLFGAYILPDAAVTLDASHYTTLQLGTRPQAGGGSQTAIGTAITTAATSWVALSQVALYSNLAGVAIAQNLTITLAKTHTGNGVAIPNMRVVLEFAEA